MDKDFKSNLDGFGLIIAFLIVSALIYNLDGLTYQVVGVIGMIIALIGFSVEITRILNKIENLDKNTLSDLGCGFYPLLLFLLLFYFFKWIGVFNTSMGYFYNLYYSYLSNRSVHQVDINNIFYDNY
ncbi:hypothetical protein [Geomicrobium sp. JCM 19038]|uniref:hypothetical protein n=1 Tax=Geomicrobium sp. JCM 19038 TaxID=1460635 RepID=UPI0005A6D1E2|nr:hypothetical protein [Geomicrobium sp. JCM 19038]